MRSAEGLSPHREISPRSDMAALPQQGAAPLAPLCGYPCTPTKTVYQPLASVPFLRVLLSYPGGDTHSHLPLERRHCEPRKRQISRCRSRLPKHTITELDRSKIEEQKKAVRSGYDMDIIPSDLATYGKDAKALLKELQSQNERMFLLTFLVMNTGETEQELETNVFQASSIAQKYNCNLRRLDFQQEQGLMSCLPLAQNLIEIQRSMTTSSTAIFVPFTTQELFQTGKEALYYGLNALSNNLIMVDRKKLKNPNGLILGTPGSGKSFSAKREIANAFLVTDDDVIVCDPEAEYTALVQKFEGQVIKISPSSTQYINPMDINANYSEEDNPIALKADFILSLCELIVGGKEGLQPVEKTVIDRCVHQIYQTYFENPVPENMPVLQDLYEALLRQDEKEAHHVATALVDDIGEEEDKSSQQFITLVTKAGNTFYLIIDRDKDGKSL